MKRWCLALLTTLALQAPVRSCPIIEYEFQSPNQRYTLKVGDLGSSLWRGKQKLWDRTVEKGYLGAVSDSGDLTICQLRGNWILVDQTGKELARTDGSPLELDFDPPRTCWKNNDDFYLETSQGDIYQVLQGHWRKVSNPAATPNEVVRHQTRPISDAAIQEFLTEGYPSKVRHNFRHLTPRQVSRLTKMLAKGNARAGLVLALGGQRQARAALLPLATSPTQEQATPAQTAIIVLDGPAAAPELVPALQGHVSTDLFRLYELVTCPEAVPGLVHKLEQDPNYARRALVAQTRVDLGLKIEAWKKWLTSKDREMLSQLREPSAPLWQAQHDDPRLKHSLLQQARLVAQFEVGSQDRSEVVFSGSRLMRSAGDAHCRALGWSLKDGQKLESLPDGVPENSEFHWNFQHSYLYYDSTIDSGLFHKNTLIFSEHYLEEKPWLRTQGTRPKWLPKDLRYPEFSLDGSSCLGRQNSEVVSLSLKDGSKKASPYGELRSLTRRPSIHYWLADANKLLLERLKQAGVQANYIVPGPDHNYLTVLDDEGAILLDAKSLKCLLRIPHLPWVRQATFDETGRRLALVANDSVYVYDLHPEPPNPDVDQRLLTECWTGYRLWAGGARRLTEKEYWQRRTRLTEPPLPEPDYFPVLAGVAAIGLLAAGYAHLNHRQHGSHRGPRGLA